MRVLITGAAGFIGSHLVEHILKETDWKIATLDRLDSSGNLHRFTESKLWKDNRGRVKFYFHDIKAPINSLLRMQIGKVDTVLHLAAGTHVDRSISDPLSFVYDNVLGTAHMLEYVRCVPTIQKFFFFGTDEVFGPAGPGVKYQEWDRYKSGNPYSATKAGAEELCLAYHNTFKIPVIIGHCMNNFGERQHPEKFIPSVIRNVRDGQKVTIHADHTKTRAGSRFYIHARNTAAAVLFLLENGKIGEKYNIVGEREVDNLTLARMIADYIGQKLIFEMVDFHSSRPGHDLRYALSGTKMKRMGWEAPVNFEQSLERTVKWTLKNSHWL